MVLRMSWQVSFVFWSAPVLMTAFLLLFCTPHAEPQLRHARVRWWPDWRDVRTWQLGLVQGGGAALYFGCNAFLPDYLHAIGRSGLIDAGLTALNTGQLPASLLLMLFGRRLVGRKEPFIIMALVGFASLAGLLVPSTPVMIAAAALVGFAAAFIMILTLALPPLLAQPDDVHRLAAGMLAIGYTMTFIVPYLGGVVWDATLLTEAALLPGAVGALIVVVIAATLRLAPEG